MSGIEVDKEIPVLYNEMKLRSTNKYMTFKIENKKKVVVDYASDPKKTSNKEEDKESFAELKERLTKEPRYILYDFGFTNKESREIRKIAFVFW